MLARDKLNVPDVVSGAEADELKHS